jgi:hypothetical protein
MSQPEPRRAPPRPRVHPPRPSPENEDRAPSRPPPETGDRTPARPPPETGDRTPARPPPEARPPELPQPPGYGVPGRLPVFPWFFLAVQVLFLVLVIAAALASDHGTAEAVSHQVARSCLNGAWQGPFTSQRACLEHFHVALPQGQDLDPGLSPGLVAIAWLVADVLLGLGYGLYCLARARR